MQGLGAAVCMMSGCTIQGVTRLVQLDEDQCVIEGTIDGLTPGSYRLAVHEYGDLSNGCDRLDLPQLYSTYMVFLIILNFLFFF